MNAKQSKVSDVVTKLTVSLDEKDLADIKKAVFNKLRPEVKADGFRPGKAPDNIVEKKLGSDLVQGEVLEAAVNRFYVMAASQEELKPLDSPNIKVLKFVPYTELEFEAEVEVAPKIKLPDYKKIKKSPKKVTVTEKDIDEVLDRLRLQTAEKKSVDRAAKDKDEVWIDFEGKDSKGEPVKGTDGKNYPLSLGSNTFIPGFEPELIGLKKGDEKTFEVKFPNDYHAKTLANQKVTFSVKVNDVKEVVLPEINDEFAQKVSPLKTVKELRADVKKQLEAEKEGEANSELRKEVLQAVVDKCKFTTPPKLLERVTEQMRNDFEQNLVYRGMTLDQYLDQSGQTKEEFEKTELLENAERRARTSLVLTEIAEAEKLQVSREELDMRLQMLKGQYQQDEKMQEELEKPESRRDIASQLLTEKTIEKLVQYATN